MPTETTTQSLTEDPASADHAADLNGLDISDIRRFRDGTHLPYFARLRTEHPIHFCADSPFGAFWSITRAADILAINADHQRFSSKHNVIIGDIPDDFHYPAFMVSDPPSHGIWRRVVAPGFTRARMADIATPCRANIAALLDDLPRHSTFDWVERLSAKLTPWMIGALFDLDAVDVASLMDWSNQLVDFEAQSQLHPGHQKRNADLQDFATYLKAKGDARKASGAPDLFSLLMAAPHGPEMAGDMAHFMGTVSLVVGAGETTRSAASALVVAMNQFPEEWQRLKQDRSLIGNAVQEVIRWQTPLAHMRRTARQDVEIKGARIRAGDRVVLWYCSGNRDEAMFPKGDSFDVRRPNARKHLSYGYGIHRCIGRHAAEMQLGILLDEMIARFACIELTKPPQRTASNYFAGYDDVRVRLV